MADDKRNWPKHVKASAGGKQVQIPPGNTPVIESPGSVVSRPNGPNAQIINTNMLSTPVFVVLVMALFLAAAMSAVAIGMAFNANYAAQLAERTAAVSRNHADNLETRVIALENAAKIDQRSKN